MQKRSRYLLIIICFAVFFSLVPVIVFYIRGIKYNSGNYLQTGILSVRTEPKGAHVYLDGKLSGDTPADIRFVKPGEYNVRIERDGYRTWEKRMGIFPGKVTWINADSGKIYLFLSQPKTAFVAHGVLDFHKLSSGWLYLTSDSLVVTSDDEGKQAQSIPLPKPAVNIIPSANGALFLLGLDKGYILFDLNSKKFTDISQATRDSGPIMFDNADNIWTLKGSSLVKIERLSLRQTPVAQNVSTFTVQGGSIYYIQKNTKSDDGSLFVLPANAAGDTGQLVVSSVPLAEHMELLVTEQKEIFALSDGSLYRLNGSINKLAEGVREWHYQASDASLVFVSSGELEFYDFSDHTPKLITRSAEGFFSPLLQTEVGHAFYVQGKKLIAAELDTQDHQNTYELASLSEGGAGSKFSLDKAAKNIYLLDGGNLELITVR